MPPVKTAKILDNVQIAARRVAELLDAELFSYLLLDSEMNIAFANNRLCDYLGFAPGELTGTPLQALLANTEFADENSLLSDAPRDTQKIVNTALKRKGGETCGVELRITAFPTNGENLTLAIIEDLSGRQVMEAELRESRERFRKIFDHSNDAILVVDPAGDRIVDANHKACAMLGYSYEEILQIPMTAIHREEMPQLMKFANSVYEKGHGWTNELSCTTKDGCPLPAEISASIIEISGKNYMIALVRDITERKQAEKAIRESEARLRSILRSAMDAIITIDAGMNIVLFNEAAQRMFGCPACEIEGKSFDEFLPPDFCKLLSRHIRAWQKGDAAEKAVWAPEGLTALRANGEEFPIECTISRVDLPEETLFTVILRDINDRKKAEEALEKLQLEKSYLQEEIGSEYNFDEIIGTSPAITKVFQNIEKVAKTDATVLIIGETGTGKELVARAIHTASHRKDRPLVKVNCAALPSGLIESELFGHEKGAFTGATSKKAGRFELADGGTIFLDEVGELPLDTQTKLLRVLQEQEFERVGGSESKKVDVRVIAATNRDLEEEVKAGSFRADLFFRLNIFPIQLPPLRQRQEDIPILTDFFLRKYSVRMGKNIRRVSPEVQELLQNYSWPGNVRELANILERATILCDKNEIKPEHINITTASNLQVEKFPAIAEVERQHILAALKKTNGVIGGPHGAASLLGLNRTTLISRMKKLGVWGRRTGK